MACDCADTRVFGCVCYIRDAMRNAIPEKYQRVAVDPVTRLTAEHSALARWLREQTADA